MKIDPLFKDCLADVAPEIRSEVRLNMDIANRIYDILQEKNMTQREFAALMGKCESEISRWLTGSHGFTTTSIAKISAVLNEPIVEVMEPGKEKVTYVKMTPEKALEVLRLHLLGGQVVTKYTLSAAQKSAE